MAPIAILAPDLLKKTEAEKRYNPPMLTTFIAVSNLPSTTCIFHQEVAAQKGTSPFGPVLEKRVLIYPIQGVFHWGRFVSISLDEDMMPDGELHQAQDRPGSMSSPTLKMKKVFQGCRVKPCFYRVVSKKFCLEIMQKP
ncbi:MAG: hypothetical protein JRI80_01990, partial [Deltaproteobacteria bacterium]|nr:hypothetical protein [Deltaproteobacteria bacterium]